MSSATLREPGTKLKPMILIVTVLLSFNFLLPWILVHVIVSRLKRQYKRLMVIDLEENV